MSARREPVVQYQFPWASDEARVCLLLKRRRSRSVRAADDLAWPPRKGDKIYFQAGPGIQAGVLRETRQGLVWLDYILEDGSVAPERDLVMCPVPTPWRDPSTVSEAERKACIARVKVVLDAGLNLMKVPDAWADFLQYCMYTLLQIEKEHERKATALLSLTSPGRPPS